MPLDIIRFIVGRTVAGLSVHPTPLNTSVTCILIQEIQQLQFTQESVLRKQHNQRILCTCKETILRVLHEEPLVLERCLSRIWYIRQNKGRNCCPTMFDIQEFYALVFTQIILLHSSLRS